MIKLDQDRFVKLMKEHSKIGATSEGGLHRLALTEQDKKIRDWFVSKLEKADLDIRIDEFGNIFGRREGLEPNGSPILLGSHLDSQPDGGIYDGALGVISALEFILTLEDNNIATDRPIEIVNWTNEEGSRFQPAMQGSGVWTGKHSIKTELEKTDNDGNVLEDELKRIGYSGEAPAKPVEEYEVYLESHIEQGPYLDISDSDIGVVTGVVGFTWGEITLSGKSDHSGPTPMNYRSDALVAAADIIKQVRHIPNTLGEKTVGTVGYIQNRPNSINTIPGSVTLTWGFRDPDDYVVQQAYERLVSEVEHVALREGVQCEYKETQRSSRVNFSDRCIETIQTVIDRNGYNSKRLMSMAGHDAVHLASIMDTGLVFTPSEGGKSHSANEYTSWDDCYKAAQVLSETALEFATMGRDESSYSV